MIDKKLENSQTKTNGFGKLVFYGIIFLVLYATNPKLPEHHSSVNRIINSEMNSNKPENQETNIITGILTAFGDDLIRSLAAEMISIDDYLIFSITILELEGERHSIGIGILGNVYVFEQADSEIRRLIREKIYNN
jgi:hypothetical protein